MKNNKRELYGLIKTCYLPFGKELTEELFGLWCSALEGYSMPDISQAFKITSASSRYPPVPADITEKLPNKDGHPSPEVAWQLLPKTSATGEYITNQMATAMGACWLAIESGDAMARMAFLEAYKQALVSAQINEEKAVWFYSAPDSGTHDQKLDIKLHKTHQAMTIGKISLEVGSEKIKVLCDQLNRPFARYLPNELLADDSVSKEKARLNKIRISDALQAIGL